MNRFPLLTTYQVMLQIGAVLLILTGAGAGYMLSQSTQGSEAFAFMIPVVLSAVIALGLLITAEVLELFLSMEHHLYRLQRNNNSTAVTPDDVEYHLETPAEPPGPGAKQIQKAYKLFERGMQAYKKKDYAGTVDLLSKVIAIDPVNVPMAHYYTAISYSKMGDTIQADQHMRIFKELQQKQ